MLQLIPGIIATSLVGFIIATIILRKERDTLKERMALSYPLGMGVVSLQYLLYSSINLVPSLINIFLPWLVVAILQYWRRPRTIINTPAVDKRSLVTFEKFLLCGIIFEVLFSLFKALIKPLASYDAVAIYAIRSKILYESGGIFGNFFSHITKLFPNSGHPPMIPLLESWAYTLMNGIDEFSVKLIFPLYLISLLAVFYFALKPLLGRTKSLLFTFLLGTIPQFLHFSSVGYADFVFTTYFTIAFLYIYRWMDRGGMRYIVLSSVAMALACWTKMEGWALLLCLSTCLVFFACFSAKSGKSAIAGTITFILLVLILASPWIYMIKANGLESEAMKLHSLDAGRITGSLGNIDRIPRILYEFQKQFFGPKKWNILWVIFFTLFFFNLKRAFKGKILYITALLFLIMCAYGFAYLLIPLRPNEPINWIIGSALSRLFIHFTPLAVYWIAVICRERDYIRL